MTGTSTTELASLSAEYYDRRLKEFGPTANGVDWNSEESQRLRFRQLLRCMATDLSEPVTVIDYGCGYGALLDELEFVHVNYVGFDVSENMIAEANRLHPDKIFTSDRNELEPANYVIASGLFNTRQSATDEAWQKYVLETLDEISDLTINAFAFNMLTTYSDRHRMREDLYYADPTFFFDHCKERYSRNVALLHDYDLYEFTMLVRLIPGGLR